MNGKPDIAKGRIKEAAGVLTGNEELKQQGRVDQVIGNTKEALQKTAAKAKKGAKKTIKKLKSKI